MVESTGGHDEGEGRNTESGVGVDARLLWIRVDDKEIVVKVCTFESAIRTHKPAWSPGKASLLFGWERTTNRDGARWVTIYQS